MSIGLQQQSKRKRRNTMNTLWAMFLTLQVLGAGHINYQQESGYYEMNPVYGRHPSAETVYAIKGAEIAIAWSLTKLLPRYKEQILKSCISFQLGFMAYDKHHQGISLSFKF